MAFSPPLGTKGGGGGGGGGDYPKFRITQPAQISATAGGSVILTCTLSGDGPNGKVIWKKGSGGEERLFYTRSPGRGEQSDSRASFVKDSDRDKSIQITDLATEDSGTYYCVKFKGDDKELRRGNGSRLSVAAKPSRPSDPTMSDVIGAVRILGMWNFKAFDIPFNGSAAVYEVTGVLEHEVQVQNEHLCGYIRFPPEIKLDLLPEAKVNSTVQLHCNVTHYYPQNIRVTWFENEIKWENGGSETVHRNEDGSYNLVNSLQFTATKEKNQSVFTCQVVRDSRHHIGNRSVSLRVKAEPGKEDTQPPPGNSGNFIYIIATVVTLLILIPAVAFCIVYLYQRKVKHSSSEGTRHKKSVKEEKVRGM
nr:PREDICTED: tyrosine-protein phosphatase non-receptor type substrate 1-like [Latimeria chalumnae]|eukprot:XP_006009387.2 PREDICTED: tyrosine-protein phosphatase non-receptor type substrate 1-like [Latimeria chalumnae]